MKVAIVVEVDVSPTIIETMKRTGFTVALDGTAMQVRVPNSPAIPQRKVKVTFVENQEQLNQYQIGSK